MHNKVTRIYLECQEEIKNVLQFKPEDNLNNYPSHCVTHSNQPLPLEDITHTSIKQNPAAINHLGIYALYSKQIPHEYLLNIWDTLRQDEGLVLQDIKYENIIRQHNINEKMRAILIDWIIEVHYRFNLRPQTLFLAVNIIDRFLSIMEILRSQLQLLGVTALFISCKYEEILCPDLRDFVYITDKTYSKKEILLMEKEILILLGFNVTVPTSLSFFEIIALNFNFNQVEFMYGRYLLELYMIDTKINRYSPSLIALAVSYIIMKTNNRSNYTDLYALVNEEISLNNARVLKECAKEIYFLVQNAEMMNFKAALKKFSSKTFLEVSIKGCKLGN